MKAALFGAFLGIVLAVIALRTGFVQIHGFDWTIGTDTHYVYAYLPNLDFGYEVAQ